jgi:hypothetical protein
MKRRATRQVLGAIVVTAVSLLVLALARRQIPIPPGEAVGIFCLFLIIIVYLAGQGLVLLCLRSCAEDDRECERKCYELYYWLSIVIPVIAVTCVLSHLLF